MNFKITGTGSCVPDITKTNTEFLDSNFLMMMGIKLKDQILKLLINFNLLLELMKENMFQMKLNLQT
jgi:hypothetical protein